MLFGTGSCPSGFAQNAVVSKIDAGANACACGCDAPNGACKSGNLTLGYGTSCGLSEPYPVTGGCQMFTGGTPVTGQYAIGATPPVSGSCVARNIANDAGVAATSNTVCHPPTTCDNAICNGPVPSGWQACVAHLGDMPCPSGSFSTRTVVGTDTSLTCSGCTCSTANVSCAGDLTYFSDMNCGTPVVSIASDAGCVSASGGLVFSYKWNGVVVDAGCAPSGTPTPSVSLVQTTTVCCR
nr:hypothetical protein Hi04_10k_c3883_00014 [uncultured bacterium]